MHIQRLLPFLFLLPLAAGAQTPCVDGSAGEFSCEGVDLLAHLSQAELGLPGSSGSDIWGWTDPLTGDEYALMYTTTGTSFVDVSNPTAPEVVGTLPSEIGFSCTWRDGKVANDYVFIVADCGSHGIQVFDLTRLREVTSPPETFDADAVYSGIENSHNIDVLEEAGLAFPVGSNVCSAGLEMVDISDPLNPTQAGCYNEDNYVHDTQCVRYDGPDTDYTGSDICFNSTGNSDNLSIVDISDPAAPQQISEVFYQPGADYSHQGWLSDDSRYFFLNDELTSSTGGTRTYVFDVEDLNNPEFLYMNEGTTPAAAHNLYILDGLMHQSNYRAGYRLWDVQTPGKQSSLSEIAWFDTHPESDDACPGGCTGAWSNYPYFDSGIVIVSDIARGLFVLDPNPRAVAASLGFSAPEAGPGDVVTVEASVLNRGDVTASGVAFSNTLPEGLTFDGNIVTSAGTASESDGTVSWTVDIDTDSTETIAFDVLIAEDVSTGTLQNTALVTPPVDDPYELSASIFIDVQPDLTFTSTEVVAIPAGGYPDDCAVSTLEVSDAISFEELRLGATIEHSWRGDVVVSLESPNGATTATLIDQPGGSGNSDDNIDALVMDAGAPGAIGSEDQNVSPPFYEVRGAPEGDGVGALADFQADNTQGEWTLTVCDHIEADTGSILQWGLLLYGVSVDDTAGPDVPTALLSAPQPNPASGITTFTVGVDRGQDITVEVFDATGRRVQTLYDGALAAGTTETIELNASALPAGVYMIRATSEEIVKTQRVTVVR